MRKPVFLFMALLGCVGVVGYLVGIERMPVMAGFIVFCVALGVSFARGTDALYIIIFAMLFSPEIGTGIATGRTAGEGAAVVFRLEDLLLIAVGVGWLLRTAYDRRHFGILKTSLNAPIGLYMTVAIAATLLGVLRGAIELPRAFFHNLKLFEYFFIYFMIMAHVRDMATVRKMIAAMIVAFFVVLGYGYYQIGAGVRVTAPFDAEPNTFGGYIVFMMCVCAGFLLTNPRGRLALPLAGLLFFALPPLLFTFSRASYLALMVGSGAFALFSRYRYALSVIAVAFGAALMLGVPLLPDATIERVASTFRPGSQYHVQLGGVDFDPSASARLVSYRQAIDRWTERPLIGHGLTGTHFIDGQFVRVLAETGMLGLSAFLLLIWRLLAEVSNVYTRTREPFLKGAALGLLTGIVAILGHALTANSFIIIRIAEPLWMITGLVLVGLKIEQADRDRAPGTQVHNGLAAVKS